MPRLHPQHLFIPREMAFRWLTSSNAACLSAEQAGGGLQ